MIYVYTSYILFIVIIIIYRFLYNNKYFDEFKRENYILGEIYDFGLANRLNCLSSSFIVSIISSRILLSIVIVNINSF